MIDNKKQKIEENEEYFKIFSKLPMIMTIIIGVLFFVLAIVDSSEGIILDTNATFIIWVAIGAVVCAVSHYLLRMKYSYQILHILYLAEINKKMNCETVKVEEDKKEEKAID